MSRKTARWTMVAGLAAIIMTAPVHAAETRDQPEQATPAKSGWSTDVSPEAVETAPATDGSQSITLSPEQTELVEKISAYFNSIKHLEGRFTQVNPDNERLKGKFYVRRPGLLRFDYAPPSKLRVVADGQLLSIEDHALKTVDQYPLDRTPFRLLLSENVDLLRDAIILDLSQSEDVASLTLEDRTEGAQGRLQLFFALPGIELKEWVVTDPQGLDTRIQLADVVFGKEVDRAFFQSSALDFASFPDQ
jgi:outer membrane lipoprotein-sorting protein